MTTPMTAAEYREANRITIAVWPEGNPARTLAALEEREALLGEREAEAPFTAVGRGLVDSSCVGAEWNRLLAAARAAWDSLLPKEPEVAPSGWTYEVRHGRGVWQVDHCGRERPICDAAEGDVPPCDAPVVAKLMAKGGKDG